MVIQSIRVVPSGPDQADAASHVSWESPTGAVRSDWKHLPTDQKVGGSNPSERATQAQARNPHLTWAFVRLARAAEEGDRSASRPLDPHS
jgi:hypothetical protein